MEIEERTAGPAVFVFPIGRLDGVSAPLLEDRVCAIARRGESRVVLDCSRMTYISSAGLRALIICSRECRFGGGQLLIAALRPECRSVLEVCGLLSFLSHHETSEAALAAPDRAAPGGGRRQPEAAEDGSAAEIGERREGPTVIVSVTGRLDGAAAGDLEEGISGIVARGDSHVVLDCSRMVYVSSGGLRALLICARICRQEGGKLVIVELQPHCRQLVSMSGFLSIIECHDTTVQALA